MSDIPVIVGKAYVNTKVANTLARLQEDNNEELSMLIDSLDKVKRFLIGSNGSDKDPSEILSHLSDIQILEDNPHDLKY